MPYEVRKDLKSETESLGKTRAKMAKEIQGLEPGQSALGYIGDGLVVETLKKKPKYSPDEINERQGIRNLLKKYIVPPALGSKFTDRQIQIRFTQKVDGQSLADLRRFWDKKMPGDGVISIEEQAELQKFWDDLSP